MRETKDGGLQETHLNLAAVVLLYSVSYSAHGGGTLHSNPLRVFSIIIIQLMLVHETRLSYNCPKNIIPCVDLLRNLK